MTQKTVRCVKAGSRSLTHMVNNILVSLDQKQSVFLVLLDLSAAFDTVDQSPFEPTWHQNKAWRQGPWMGNFLPHQPYSIVLYQRNKLPSLELRCSVPKGSVLSPVFFTIYTQPLGDILRKHGLTYHLYADDTKLYLTFDHGNSTAEQSTINSTKWSHIAIPLWHLNQVWASEDLAIKRPRPPRCDWRCDWRH